MGVRCQSKAIDDVTEGQSLRCTPRAESPAVLRVGVKHEGNPLKGGAR